jgi:hypothetical protein
MKFKHWPTLAGIFVFVWAAPVAAQTASGPTSNFVMAGYGSVSWSGTTDGDFTNDFTSSLSPLFLYSLGDDFLFEAELEFGLSGELTTTSLEYAQIDYLALDRLQIIAGKFLVPFGLFGERTHPSWINKLPSTPLLYGDAHGGVAEGALLPVLSDAGVMLRYKKDLAPDWSLNLTGWVSQGPKAAASEDDEEEAHKAGGTQDEGLPVAGALAVPGLAFGVGFADNNSNKMLGGRIGLVNGPKFEVYVSGFHARYDTAEELDVVAGNVAVEYRTAALDLKAEGLTMWQDFELEEAIEVVSRTGYYLQAARRIGAWEPVARWSHLTESSVDGLLAFAERREFSVGLNFWFEPSIPLKVSYHADLDEGDHILVQWAFGF